ncbi:hypothetical protein [Spiroplasma sp. Moj]|uniref:hypothetical protein n=1 Tax=Spiroplasma sp. Moj TaxID=1922342 RepID=UPI0039EEDEDA
MKKLIYINKIFIYKKGCQIQMDTNYVQNEQENVQTNVIQNKKPDNLCLAGCIRLLA